MPLTDSARAELAAITRARLAQIEIATAAATGATATVELDQQSVGRLSRMDALQGQAMARATAARRQAEAARLKSALARLDRDPDFGFCSECGEPIGLERLRIEPALTRCAECMRGA
jgi:DnaK suppressor protein